MATGAKHKSEDPCSACEIEDKCETAHNRRESDEEIHELQLRVQKLELKVDALTLQITTLTTSISGLVESWNTARGLTVFIKWASSLVIGAGILLTLLGKRL